VAAFDRVNQTHCYTCLCAVIVDTYEIKLFFGPLLQQFESFGKLHAQVAYARSHALVNARIDKTNFALMAGEKHEKARKTIVKARVQNILGALGRVEKDSLLLP